MHGTTRALKTTPLLGTNFWGLPANSIYSLKSAVFLRVCLPCQTILRRCSFIICFRVHLLYKKYCKVMCAYNAVNGLPNCANGPLLDRLYGELEFGGLVVTDCGAIGFSVHL